MTTEEILDAIDELLDKAMVLPLSNGKCIVDAEKLRDYLNDLRMSLPVELKQARSIVSDRNEILAAAKKEAEISVKVAMEKSRHLVSESEIVKQAMSRAKEVEHQAMQRAKEIKQSTNDYVEGVLKRVDDTLTHALSEIRQTKQNYKNAVFVEKQQTFNSGK